jgi:DNA mismatch repair protein MutS2
MTSTEADQPAEKNRLLEKSTRLLGWELIQSALAHHAASPVAAEQCDNLVPIGDFDSAVQALEETREMHLLLQFDVPFPLNAYQDIRPVLEVARSQLVIESAQGLGILKLLRLCRALQRFLDKQTLCPQLKVRAQALDPIPELLKDLERCIDDDGEIRDNASPELKQAIHEVARARQKLEDRMQKLIGSSTYQTALQDNYFTEREERLVVPIRAEFKSRIEGIVHDSSGSGQTLFIEPSAIVPLNNQLKISRMQVEQEKARILRSLAEQIAGHFDLLHTNLAVLVAVDLVHCRAQLARSMQASKRAIPNWWSTGNT